MATRQEWAERVAQWKASGLAASAYAAREGLSATQLCTWKWFLKKGRPKKTAVSAPLAGETGRRTKKAVAGVPLVPRRAVTMMPVRLRPSGGGGADVGPVREHPGRIEITVRGGRMVRAEGAVDPNWLARVVSCLEEGAHSQC